MLTDQPQIIPFHTLQKQWLSPRDGQSHKGNFGHVLVVGGDEGMAGAVRMAGEGAARVGAGLVTVVTHKAHLAVVNVGRPELMCHGVEEPNEFATSLLERATVVVLGPGLGHSAWSAALFAAVIDIQRPLVVDADGLKALAQKPRRNSHWILTPHVGEASALLAWDKATILANRKEAVMALQQRYGGVIILKGQGTLVCGSQDEVTQCPFGNPGMATGGMGDVLSGILGGLLAQNIPLLEAAQLGVCLHGLAGDKVAQQRGERGLLASDLMAVLPSLCNGIDI
ncbi:MAG: NAD(P)H-hydrate dehydratase [Gammaproteobacteria bacterium]